MMQAMPERTTALAKKELLFTGAWGVTAWLCGLVFVDRLNPQRARDTMKKTVKYLQTSDVRLARYLVVSWETVLCIFSDEAVGVS